MTASLGFASLLSSPPAKDRLQQTKPNKEIVKGDVIISNVAVVLLQPNIDRRTDLVVRECRLKVDRELRITKLFGKSPLSSSWRYHPTGKTILVLKFIAELFGPNRQRLTRGQGKIETDRRIVQRVRVS